MTPAELNAEYKRRFHEITAKLGRVCVPSDKEFWELSEWFKSEWKVGGPETAPQYQIDKAHAVAWGGARVAESNKPEPTPTDRIALDILDLVLGTENQIQSELERQAREQAGSSAPNPLERAREAAEAVDARTGQAEDDEAGPGGDQALGGPGAGQTAREAASSPAGQSAQRGASGGQLRVCVLCGQGWEAPNARGRPSSVCGDCRKGK